MTFEQKIMLWVLSICVFGMYAFLYPFIYDGTF